MVALDDVMLIPGRFCGLPASCDFQHDTCGYDNIGAKLNLRPLTANSPIQASSSDSAAPKPIDPFVRRSSREDGLVDWERAAAGSVPIGTAPNNSHSHPTGGFFMYVPAQDTKEGDSAYLISETVGRRQVLNRNLCLYFWYQLVGKGTRSCWAQSKFEK